MNEIERLFLNTLKDLQTRNKSEDDYEVLGASGLIRKLLLDEAPLVDQVNRKYRLKIKFEIAQTGLPPGLPEPMIYSVQDGIDPETAVPPVVRRTVTRSQLHSHLLVKIEGRRYSFQDIVLFEAHVMGGIHAGAPKSEKERALGAISQLAIGGRRASLRQLQAMGRIVLKGLDPMKEAIARSESARRRRQ